MIKVKITSKVGATFEKELPANIHELHHALVEMGIRKTPRSLLLMDDNAAEVELTADSEIGNGLLRVFGRKDTLAQVWKPIQNMYLILSKENYIMGPIGGEAA